MGPMENNDNDGIPVFYLAGIKFIDWNEIDPSNRETRRHHKKYNETRWKRRNDKKNKYF